MNLHGQWVMAKVVAPLLVRQRWGRIVNVASIAAYLHQLSADGDPDNFELSNYAYMQSKWGVLGLTRHMAGQLGQFNVTVNCIAPGLTNTAATEKQVPTDFQPDVRHDVGHAPATPSPSTWWAPAVFFASSDADLVNGQVHRGRRRQRDAGLSARSRRGDPHRARPHRAARRHRRPRRVPHALHRRRGVGDARQPGFGMPANEKRGHDEIRAGAEERRAGGRAGSRYRDPARAHHDRGLRREPTTRATARSYFMFFGSTACSRCCARWVSTTTCSSRASAAGSSRTAPSRSADALGSPSAASGHWVSAPTAFAHDPSMWSCPFASVVVTTTVAGWRLPVDASMVT